MDAVDCHFHWFPTEYYRLLERRDEFPRAERSDGRWSYVNGNRSVFGMSPEWFDLDMQFETVRKTGLTMAVVGSMGIHSDLDGLPALEAKDAARVINEALSAAQQHHSGSFFGAAAVPLQDAQMAVDELTHAVQELDLRGVSIPGSVAGEPLDSPRLEPFYGKVEELGVPMLIHPTDGTLVDVLSGYNNRLYSSLGRVVDSSVAVLRLILGGVMDRYPRLKILHFHAGGVLPYAAGRLDKNARSGDICEQPSAYLRRMWVDTVMPQPMTVRMAMEFYGRDRVLYGSDNPCWNPRAAVDVVQALGLSEVDRQAVLVDNVRNLIDLDVRTPSIDLGAAS